MEISQKAVLLLRKVIDAEGEYDGFYPHGAGEHAMIRTLLRERLVEKVGDGVCCDCDSPAHGRTEKVGPLYKATQKGRE